MKRSCKFLAILSFLLLISLCPSQIRSEDKNQMIDTVTERSQDEKLVSQEESPLTEESELEKNSKKDRPKEKDIDRKEKIEEQDQERIEEDVQESEEKEIEDQERLEEDVQDHKEKEIMDEDDHEKKDQEIIKDEKNQESEKNDEKVKEETTKKEMEDHPIQKGDDSQENTLVQARTIRVEQEQALISHVNRNYRGKIRSYAPLGRFDFNTLIENRETASIPQLSILNNRPMYVDYMDGTFDVDGAFEVKAYTLSDRRGIFSASYSVTQTPVVSNHRIYQGLELYIQAYDHDGRAITAVEDESQALYLKTSFSGRADARGVFAINKQNLSLNYGNRNRPQKTENKENIRRFLSANMMRASLSGLLSAHVIDFQSQRRLSLANQYSVENLINTNNIGEGRNYERNYGENLRNYVQFRNVEQDAEFTRAPKSHLSFEDGHYYLNSDVGLRSKERDWMLVAMNYPGDNLDGSDCDCDWARYYDLSDLYREKIDAGEESFDIEWQAKLGNRTPEVNHSFYVQYFLIDPKNINPEDIAEFDWDTRSKQEDFEALFPKESIQKTSLTSVHYFDLTLSIENSVLYRQNKMEDGKMLWEIEQYIDSDFLVEADQNLQDEAGNMKNYNIKVRLYSENPYADHEVIEEACILLDGHEIPVELEEYEQNGQKRYNHRFSLRKKLPHACEGEAKPMHFDEAYRYYIRASIQRKVEGTVDVYLRSGYHDIAVEKQGKVYRRMINRAYEYDDQLIYIHPLDAKEDVFDSQAYIDFYKEKQKQQGQAVSYMGYVYDVPNGDDPNDYAIVEDEKLIQSDGKTSYMIFYPDQALMYLNQDNNFLSFHFPYLYRDEDKNYHAKTLTDTKITNPYFVISNDDSKQKPMQKVSVRMLDFTDEQGMVRDGFTLKLEMEIFGIRNWLFDNMDRGDSEADRTAFYELVLDQAGQSKEVHIENEEVLKEHFNVIALIAHDDYYEEGVENPDNPSGCPNHEKTSIEYYHPELLRVDEKYTSQLEWLIEYSQLEIEGGY